MVEFEKEADFKIIYIYQENAGKHSAINRALQETTSELFLIADSDDSFKANALEVFINTWESIPEGERNQYKGVIAKCYNAEDGTPIGSYPQHMFDSNDLDAYFVQRLCFEKWNIVRTDVMKELPFPEPNEKLKFYPESVVWWRMARKYKTRYIDENIRAYYHDQENSVIKQSTGRARETIYLWRFYINEANNAFSGRNEVVDRLCGYPLLVIDDFGMERGTEYALEQIYNIIDSRYRSRIPLTPVSMTVCWNCVPRLPAQAPA